MAQITPASEAIAELLAEGWNYSQIGKALGVNGSLIRQAIAPSPKQKQKPLTKYVDALNNLAGKRPGQKPAALPAKKQQNVRQKTRTVTQANGNVQTITSVKKAPVTLKNAIKDAASKGQTVRWNIKCKKIKTKSDDKGHEGWISGHALNSAALLNRIDNPTDRDSWKAGDINAALLAIAVQQNSAQITSASGAEEYNLFTAE